jgi:predicted PurR-regulated permease PerM
MGIKSSASLTRLSSAFLVGATCILALLYVGRGILQPLAIASILSLIVRPLIRYLGRLGVNRTIAAMLSVLLAGICVVALTVILTVQLASVTSELPRYRAAIQEKIERVRGLAERPFARLEEELSAVVPLGPDFNNGENSANSSAAPMGGQAAATQLTVRNLAVRLFSLTWGPIGQAGIVLVLLIFILLEQESLRDRVVWLAGRADMSRTMNALGDAAEGVSKFFFSQFIVNAVFGAAIGLVLWLAGIPHAVLWGTLSGLLRFVPYLGALTSGLVIGVFIAAISPDWWLPLGFLALFISLEVVVANLVEPWVYGHSSGLSPLAIILSALFWGSLWGPVGLLLSTPLTLCLVVAGRHVAALELITVLLGKAPDLSLAERFYQRALAGESDTLVRSAHEYLAKNSFAKYCDQVLLPGIALAALDFQSGQIGGIQRGRLRAAMTALMETLVQSGSTVRRFGRRQHVPLLNSSLGAHLRELRMARLGRWQGSLDVPLHSVVICAGLQNDRDDLLSELLVHALSATGMDVRSLTLDKSRESPDTQKLELVCMVFMVFPLKETFERWVDAVDAFRAALPEALFVTIRPPFEANIADPSAVGEHVDMVLASFEEGFAFVTTHGQTASNAAATDAGARDLPR